MRSASDDDCGPAAERQDSPAAQCDGAETDEQTDEQMNRRKDELFIVLRRLSQNTHTRTTKLSKEYLTSEYARQCPPTNMKLIDAEIAKSVPTTSDAGAEVRQCYRVLSTS